MYMKNNKTCCFFGHREVTHNIREKLTSIIEKLIIEENGGSGLNEVLIIDGQQRITTVYILLKAQQKAYLQGI